jgi:hypothetical protein
MLLGASATQSKDEIDAVTKIPVRKLPTIPSIPWSLKTSIPSLMPIWSLMFCKSEMTIAVMKPIATAHQTVTYPAAGVIPTRPAIIPSQTPVTENLRPCLTWSIKTHTIAPVEAAAFVLNTAIMALIDTLRAEPPCGDIPSV